MIWSENKYENKIALICVLLVILLLDGIICLLYELGGIKVLH